MAYIVCMNCQQFFHPKTNGVRVEEGMPAQASRQSERKAGWAPYKLWAADLLECKGCGAQVVTGFSHEPIAHHFEPGYQRAIEANEPIAFVADCP